MHRLRAALAASLLALLMGVVTLAALGGTGAHAATTPTATVPNPDIPPTGTSVAETYKSATGNVTYRIYTPASYHAGTRVPLVVFTHGCLTTALQQENASGYDQVADQNGFIVAYPDDNDAVHPAECWRFYDGSNSERGQSDLATIVGITHAVMGQRSIDPSRVYEVAMSSGALITSDLGAAYPDVYAAIGIMAGGPYGTPPLCLGDRAGLNVGTNPLTLGQKAAAEMAGAGPRVMPVIVLNGDADNTVPPQCDSDAITQWLTTDNLVTSGTATAPFSSTPISTSSAAPANKHAYQVLTYGNSAGCMVAQHWIIHGMDHFWSGGTTNPTYATFTDPKGPSAAAATWAFFSRYTLSSHLACPPPTKLPAPKPTKPKACRSLSTLVLSMPAGRVTTTVNGHRVHVNRNRAGRVVLNLKPYRGRRISVVTRVGHTVHRDRLTLCR